MFVLLICFLVAVCVVEDFLVQDLDVLAAFADQHTASERLKEVGFGVFLVYSKLNSSRVLTFIGVFDVSVCWHSGDYANPFCYRWHASAMVEWYGVVGGCSTQQTCIIDWMWRVTCVPIIFLFSYVFLVEHRTSFSYSTLAFGHLLAR